MTIRNVQHFIDSHWDWKILDGCFGKTKIRPSDIDGMVEKNGRVLLIETKSPGATVPEAQMRAYRSLVRQGCCLMIVWGEPGKPTNLRIMDGDVVLPELLTDCPHPRLGDIGLEIFQHCVKIWYEAARDNEPPVWITANSKSWEKNHGEAYRKKHAKHRRP